MLAYHTTIKRHLPSIKQKGLIPSVRWQRLWFSASSAAYAPVHKQEVQLRFPWPNGSYLAKHPPKYQKFFPSKNIGQQKLFHPH
jgi:hypothetical protein